MPSRTANSAGHREDGTALVELVAVVPFLLLAVLAAVQIALAGQALWSASVAARAGARAALVGGEATVAARRALPPSLRARRRGGGGGRHLGPGAGAAAFPPSCRGSWSGRGEAGSRAMADERGQAAVELVAAMPALLLAASWRWSCSPPATR